MSPGESPSSTRGKNMWREVRDTGKNEGEETKVSDPVSDPRQ